MRYHIVMADNSAAAGGGPGPSSHRPYTLHDNTEVMARLPKRRDGTGCSKLAIHPVWRCQQKCCDSGNEIIRQRLQRRSDARYVGMQAWVCLRTSRQIVVSDMRIHHRSTAASQMDGRLVMIQAALIQNRLGKFEQKIALQI